MTVSRKRPRWAGLFVDQIVELMHRLTEEGLTLVLVEQNVGVALDLLANGSLRPFIRRVRVLESGDG